jgi:hypothetical protein
MPCQEEIPTPERWANIFRQDVAAEVPAIKLTRDEWNSILFIIQTLGDLVDECCPHNLEAAVIQGRVINEAANKAWGLKHWLRL